MKITNEMLAKIRDAVAPGFHGLSYRERMIVRRTLEAALTHPCTCREDVACGACMSGATDPATATSPSPPTNDVRKALISALHEARRLGLGGMTEQQAQEHMADAILARFEVRPRGTVTDAAAWRALNVLNARTGTVFPDGLEMVKEMLEEAQR